MGVGFSCSSKGALLIVAAVNGDIAAAHEVLKKYPKAALYHNFKDRTSPLIQASARGHFDLVQLILETAVMTDGPEKARRNCIDHTNAKHQTALIVACKHGHPDCVEYLVTNGADPMVCDERRHNTCLHFAALYGHSDCVNKLLGSKTTSRGDQGRQSTVAQLICKDEDDTPNIRFVDRHNGWGLTALHIAVFQGSVHTVRALLRHGASLESTIVPAKIENSPIRCAIGSTALHIAALIGNIAMAKALLEAQETIPGLELRSRTDSAGLRPQEYAQRARNPVLVHLLDERLPVALLRQIWMNYSMEQSLPPRHQTLGAMLQKLKLMFNLETIALQANLSNLMQQQQQADAAAAGEDSSFPGDTLVPAAAAAAKQTSGTSLAPHFSIPTLGIPPAAGNSMPATAQKMAAGWQPQNSVSEEKALWTRRLEQVQALLATSKGLHEMLQSLCEKPETGEWSSNGPNSSQEAILDFILSTLITPRTVSAIVHAAKKLVCSNVMAMGPSGSIPAQSLPPDIEVQHGIALLTTAMRAVDTCLQAAAYLSNPASMMINAPGPAGGPGTASGTAAATVSGGSTANMEQATPPPGSSSSSYTVGTNNATVGTGAASVAATSVRSEATHVASEMSGPVTLPPALPSVPLPPPPTPILINITGASLHMPPFPNSSFFGGTGVAMPAAMMGLSAGMAASMGHPQGSSLFTSHWSAHLHSLIAQLHWDIGVQRHRRRRQHAAAQAARAQAAAQRATAEDAVSVTAQSAPISILHRTHSPNHATFLMEPQALLTTGTADMVVANASVVVGAGAAEMLVCQNSTNLFEPILHPNATALTPLPSNEALAAAIERNTVTVGIIDATIERSASSQEGEASPPRIVTTPIITPITGGSGGLAASVVARPSSRPSSRQLSASRAPVESVWSVQSDMSGGSGRHSGRSGPSGLSGAGRGEISPRSPRDQQSSPERRLPAAVGRKVSVLDPASAMLRAMSGEHIEDGPSGKPVDQDSDEEEVASIWSDDERLVCSICMDQPVAVLVAGCQHGLCVQCAFQLTVKGRELPSCPFCRQKIPAFEAKPAVEMELQALGGKLVRVRGGAHGKGGKECPAVR
ncbi:hypothetical protein CEUSTIGMA_g8919.t1 [Chlamydomonas eustigma]|uniref:RING-type domain-containing protein n=1 Tax=Chlamydomonas eustigma TaxID=1157962 RepID=A0A250XFC6_9CHLO|nr:hypothetical protein CEUSTIGMA_g8919.t1 [Chlamydomonas eustigma]|eukprot:GAX81490.1 hypothetical protein CEUSTIGMA_g8919.t1 [Chlamydomonas eustigma]